MRNILLEKDRIPIVDRDAGVLLGIPIDRKSLQEVTEEAMKAIDRTISQRVLACANPHSLVVAQHNDRFHSALTHANQVVADGVGAVGSGNAKPGVERQSRQRHPRRRPREPGIFDRSGARAD